MLTFALPRHCRRASGTGGFNARRTVDTGIQIRRHQIVGGTPLNRDDIDALVPDHPVVVRHRGGHTSVYNSMALGLAGVTSETQDPPGGRFYRDENGPADRTGRWRSPCRFQ